MKGSHTRSVLNQLITQQKFASIAKAQSGLTKLIREGEESECFFKIMRNNQPIGTLIPERLWQRLIENLELLSSPTYVRKVYEARHEGEAQIMDSVLKEFGVNAKKASAKSETGAESGEAKNDNKTGKGKKKRLLLL